MSHAGRVEHHLAESPARFRWDEADRIAATNPDRIALKIKGEAMTYGDLVGAIGTRARWVRDQVDVTEDVRVLPILVDQSFESALAILTCLQAKIPFAVVDDDLPIARKHVVLSLLTNPLPMWNATGASSKDHDSTESLRFPDSWDPVNHRVDDGTSEPLRAEIVTFTSGTTGAPKAVAITRQTMRRRIAFRYSMDDIDRGNEFTMLSTSRFSLAPGLLQLAEVLGGVSLTVVDASRQSPIQLLEMMVAEDPTHVTFTPQLARVLGQVKSPSELRTSRTILVRISGEATRFEHIHSISRFFPETAEFVHPYGATEAAFSLGFQSRAEDAPLTGRVTLREIYIRGSVDFVPADGLLDGTFELFLAQDVAEGYVGNPELTAERFVDRGGRRMWRSGDLVRRVGDGEYLHVGRLDDVVKVSGHLVSTSEIELALSRDDEVFAGAVVDYPRGDLTALAAFVVRVDGSTAAVDEIRARLCLTIPAHMMPAQIHLVEKLPTTRAGKIDRVALRDAAINGTTN